MTVHHFSSDILEFIRLLKKHEVKYLIVGGEAVIYYGYPRLTGDVDFFYWNNQQNINALFETLKEFWSDDIPGIKKKSELSTQNYIIQFGIAPNRIDLMNCIDGVKFEDAWKEKTTEEITFQNEKLPIHFIGLKHLITNKKESGRNKDKDDLSFLIKLKST